MKLLLDDGTEYEFDKAEVVETKPGDVLVVTMRGRLSDNALARARDILEEVFKGTTCLILEDGMSIDAIMRKTDGDAEGTN